VPDIAKAEIMMRWDHAVDGVRGETAVEDPSRVGLVVIGRNEAARLGACLSSIPAGLAGVVYVDSGSHDASVRIARRAKVEVVRLAADRPFTAARARNAGLMRLLELVPRIEKVQFIDGDCTLASGWIEVAAKTLDRRPDVVAVAGSLHELHPERSIYNRLCQLEWERVPLGEAKSFGGIVMIRVESLVRVGGWNPAVIAAEDDELAIRLRRMGGKILRLEDSMAHHDAEITHFAQWWKRAVRCGHAYAQVAALHGSGSERYFVHERRRALLWGAMLPLASALGALPTMGSSLWMLSIYPLQVTRLFVRELANERSRRDAALIALSSLVGRFAEARGVLEYETTRLRGREPSIIEYKGLVRSERTFSPNAG
jgi:GT2 family glycosyltransferase